MARQIGRQISTAQSRTAHCSGIELRYEASFPLIGDCECQRANRWSRSDIRMSGTSISAIGVLCAAEAAWRDGCRNVCNVLQVPPTSTVREILVGGGEALAQQQFVNLLEGVSITVAQHGIRRTIRDWPFENFWTDPDEPLHSKFLGYFINPRQGHNCSDFLLKHFLKVLKGAIKPASLSCRTPPSFRADGCEVNDPEAERIDALHRANMRRRKVRHHHRKQNSLRNRPTQSASRIRSKSSPTRI